MNKLIELSKLSNDAYVYSRVKSNNIKNIKSINNRAIYLRSKDSQYIVVRGSMFKKYVSDWSIIANVSPYKICEHYYLHSGYYQEAERINHRY